MQSSKDNLIAHKYAEALAELRQGETVIEDLEKVRDTFLESKELTSFFSNPSYQEEDKAKVLKKIFESKVQKEVLNTLLLLLEKRRINLAPLLAANYKEIFYAKENIELAEISSATKLSDTELNEIKAQLEASFKKKVELSNSVDESLIAGLKIQISDKVIDSSLKTKIKQLKDTVLG